MLKHIFSVILLLITLSLFCNHGSPFKSVRIGEESNGKTVYLNVSDTLLVTLFFLGPLSWHIAKIDTSIIVPVDSVSQYDQPPNPGGTGKETFRFVTKRNGSTELKLCYFDAFNTDRPPTDSFSIKISLSYLMPK